MKTTYEERRLKAVKENSYFFGRVCICCKSEVRKEKMWSVPVRSPNIRQGYPDYLRYCKECAPTKQDVLEKIKNREIWNVDFPR